MGLSLKNVIESIHESLPNNLTRDSRVLKGKLYAYLEKNSYRIGFISENTAKTKKYSKRLNYIFLNTGVNQTEFIGMFYNEDKGLLKKTRVKTIMDRLKKSKIYNEINELPQQLELSLKYEPKILPYRIVYINDEMVSIIYYTRKRNFQGSKYKGLVSNLDGNMLQKLYINFISNHLPNEYSKIDFDSESGMFCMNTELKNVSGIVKAVIEYTNFIEQGRLKELIKY